MDSVPLYLDVHKELKRMGEILTLNEVGKIIETAFFSFTTQRIPTFIISHGEGLY